MTKLKTPWQAAIELIKHEVLRGDDIASIRRSWMGRHGRDYSAQVGGWADDKKYGSDKIIVLKIGDKKVNRVFSLRVVYNAIKKNQNQPSLF